MFEFVSVEIYMNISVGGMTVQYATPTLYTRPNYRVNKPSTTYHVPLSYMYIYISM